MSIRQTLIDFLKKPGSYPHHPERVKHLQTHISHVFIAAPYVYKLKKPVDLGFLDFSTIDKRKYYCEQEVKLNRRLCREIYLGVICITGSEESYRLGPATDNPAEPVEYLVKMKQLPKEHFLIAKVKKGILKTEDLERVADKLTAFYSEQKPGPKILSYGEMKVIRFNTDENFKQTESFIGTTIDAITYQTILQFTNGFMDYGESLIQKRMNQGRIVDGHGDLHLEHINITDENICIYDCIEFNERFRYQDVAADLAFLAMDLDFHNLRKESLRFTGLMSELLGDPDLLKMMDFYKCYRAYVRGKVKSIESTGEEISDSERVKAVEKASCYFRLSLSYALAGSRPSVLFVMGRVASGKSTLAKFLAGHTGFKQCSTDRIRKKLAGIPLTQRLPDEARSRLYSQEMTKNTYQKLFDKALAETRNGKSVILDGTFSDASVRQKYINIIEQSGFDYLFIEADAPMVIRRDRLSRREQSGGIISDAREEDMSQIDSTYSPPGELDENRVIRIDTSKNIQVAASELYGKLVERNLTRTLD